jgi:hypothetical protein
MPHTVSFSVPVLSEMLIVFFLLIRYTPYIFAPSQHTKYESNGILIIEYCFGESFAVSVYNVRQKLLGQSRSYYLGLPSIFPK